MFEEQKKWDSIKPFVTDRDGYRYDDQSAELYFYSTIHKRLAKTRDDFRERNKNVGWEDDWLRAFDELIKKFESESNIEVALALQSKFVQQNVTDGKTHYPKRVLVTALELVDILENSELCAKNTRDGFNRKAAAQHVIELAKLFGVRLPRNLRNKELT